MAIFASTLAFVRWNGEASSGTGETAIAAVEPPYRR